MSADLQREGYRQFMPQTLHQDVERLLIYLTHAPFAPPTACPHCGSEHFKSRQKPGLKVEYRCHECRKHFNQVTGTPFARCQFPELWPTYALYRFAGLSLQKISDLLGITTSACLFRDRVIIKVLYKDYPDLYQWWHGHQERQDFRLSPVVAQQRDQFQAWLHQLIYGEITPCPRCGEPCKRVARMRHRPQYECYPCRYNFNLLKGTPLSGMLQMEMWPAFVDSMISGESMWGLQPQFEISTSALHSWRKNFLQIMSDQGLEALVEWAQWQRGRRYHQSTKERKQGVRLSRPGKSLYNGRGQRKVCP